MNLRDYTSVKNRREAIEKELNIDLKNVGSFSLDESVAGSRNCENMIGVTQVPLGIAGPLTVRTQNSELNDQVKEYYIPLATTEGALVASVSRGSRAITESGGASVRSKKVGATRGPVFRVADMAGQVILSDFLHAHEKDLQEIAAKTSRHLSLVHYSSRAVGRNRYVRFVFDTEDAMGMNMVTIATQAIVEYIEANTEATCLSVGGNYDVDKKPAWLNTIETRGTKAWADVVIPSGVVRGILKTTAKAFYETWLAKCMVGSALAGSMGFNAHMANILTAIFLATGQDVAHVGEASVGMTSCEVDGEDLYVSVYLPDLMIGTVGGGTGLATQQEALSLLGVAGTGKKQLFAEIIAAAVLAGEISLLASLSVGSLAKSHQRLARGIK